MMVAVVLVRNYVSGDVRCGFVNRDVGVDVLRPEATVVKEEEQHPGYNPIAVHITYGVAHPILNKRHDATAANHHHKQAGCFGSVFAKAFNSKVENATPHN